MTRSIHCFCYGINSCRRVSVQIGTNSFSHAYDYIGNQTLFAANSLTNTYTHNSLNQLVGRDVPSNGNFYFPSYDNNGNITKYIDESGNVVAAYEYDDFGRLISRSGPMADFFRIRFSTKYFDPETGLYYYYGYRFYSSTLMRWLNRDPIEEEGGMNLYGFCGNNAAARIDYLGMVSIDESLLNMYDLTSDAAKGPMLAYTKATAGVIVACKCMKNEWSLSDVKVNILTQVHLRKQGYGRIGLELFVLKSEKEHVDDIRSGIRNLIFPTLVNLELILKMNKHQSNIECIESNKTAFLQQVRILIRQIEVDSASRHDKTGKHTFIW